MYTQNFSQLLCKYMGKTNLNLHTQKTTHFTEQFENVSKCMDRLVMEVLSIVFTAFYAEQNMMLHHVSHL